MKNKKESNPIYSGASPEQVAEDLKSLVEFQEKGLPLDTLQKQIEDKLIPHLMNYNRPEFQSMFNAFPEQGARLGAQITLDFNQGVTNWQVSPGGAMLEELCCRALCRLFELAPGSDATFMYCGTYANQQALYMALHNKAEKEGFDLSYDGLKGFYDPGSLAVLASCDAHFSLRHGVRTLGLGDQSLIPIPVDKNRHMDVSLLEKTIKHLKETRKIFCVTATAGTTSTGSVDPIKTIADVCSEHNIWLHVDGAYGLAYSLVPEWKPLYKGIELADSVSWDPHKQMRVPIPSSLIFVRNRDNFKRMAIHGDYFNREDETTPSPGLKSPPTTRPLSALALVTSFKHMGMKKTIKMLKSPLHAIEQIFLKLEKEEDFELGHKPDTGILCLRIKPNGFPRNHLDKLQDQVYKQILAEGQRTISITRLENNTYLRLVAISPLVTEYSMMKTISNIRKTAQELWKKFWITP